MSTSRTNRRADSRSIIPTLLSPSGRDGYRRGTYSVSVVRYVNGIPVGTSHLFVRAGGSRVARFAR